jgi:hypothetical protein
VAAKVPPLRQKIVKWTKREPFVPPGASGRCGFGDETFLECAVWVQKGDDHRNAPQWAKPFTIAVIQLGPGPINGYVLHRHEAGGQGQ